MTDKYKKIPRSYDYLPHNPNTALEKVWHHYDIAHIMWELPVWFYMSMGHERSNYCETENRVRFTDFFIDLLSFVEAAYVYYEPEIPPDREKTIGYPVYAQHFVNTKYEVQYLSSKQQKEPVIIIRKFCEKFPLHYVRIELWHFLDSVQFYDGPLKESIYKHDTCNLYLQLLTLIEAFHVKLDIKPPK